MNPRRIPRLVLIAAVSGVALTVVANTGAGAASFASGRAAATAPVPPGTVLHVGEQLNNLSTVLTLGHESQGFTYQVQYSEFVGGPPMLQAFEGGALDIGFIQSTPLIFAQAAGQHVTAVAGWAIERERLRAW